MQRTHIESPADWKGSELEGRSDWIYRFDAAEIAEIEAALRHFRASGRALAHLRKEDFPLRRFPRIAVRVLHALEDGPGVMLLQGFPVERHTCADMRMIYWGLGKYIGTAVPQSGLGDVMGDVRNVNIGARKLRYHGYRGSDELRFHADGADVTGLFVLKVSKSGGQAGLVSSVAIRNEILRTRPDLLEVLYHPFNRSNAFDRSSEVQQRGDQPLYYGQPIFTEQAGHFACTYVRTSIEEAQKLLPEEAKLTPKQVEALDFLEATSNRTDLNYWKSWQPGDLQFFNNHVLLHARTEYEDYPEPERRRHLLRVWFSVVNSRPLSPQLKSFREHHAGAVRGGAVPRVPGRILFETMENELK